jgi:hypothetical protein
MASSTILVVAGADLECPSARLGGDCFDDLAVRCEPDRCAAGECAWKEFIDALAAPDVDHVGGVATADMNDGAGIPGGITRRPRQSSRPNYFWPRLTRRGRIISCVKNPRLDRLRGSVARL